MQVWHTDKGQLILKANCQAMNSSKNWTNEFVFTTMRSVFIRFLEEIECTKKTFKITWPLGINGFDLKINGIIYLTQKIWKNLNHVSFFGISNLSAQPIPSYFTTFGLDWLVNPKWLPQLSFFFQFFKDFLSFIFRHVDSVREEGHNGLFWIKNVTI